MKHITIEDMLSDPNPVRRDRRMAWCLLANLDALERLGVDRRYLLTVVARLEEDSDTEITG